MLTYYSTYAKYNIRRNLSAKHLRGNETTVLIVAAPGIANITYIKS